MSKLSSDLMPLVTKLKELQFPAKCYVGWTFMSVELRSDMNVQPTSRAATWYDRPSTALRTLSP
jgi:hypothetical protein